MSLRAFVTGATGFVGRHLIHLLSASDYKIYGTSFPEEPSPAEKDIFHLDIRSEEGVSEVLKRTKPDWIFHLAAVSNVRHSWERRKETLETNIMGTFFLFEAVRNFVPQARILYVSSSDVYDFLKPVERPLKEDDVRRANSPYAFSKMSAEILSDFYVRVEELDIVIARSFSHTGPMQSPDFVCSDWAFQVARIEKEQAEPVIHVGNIEVKRDFTDVRDVVRAYALLMEKGRKGEVYNVCSGRAVPLRTILDTLLSFSTEKIEVRVDPQKLRKVDTPVLLGNNQKIREETSWKPDIPLKQSLRDLLEYWRGRVKNS